MYRIIELSFIKMVNMVAGCSFLIIKIKFIEVEILMVEESMWLGINHILMH